MRWDLIELTTSTGSRRLITYRRLPDSQVSKADLGAHEKQRAEAAAANTGTTADDLNPFRRGYFRKFEAES